MSKKKKLPKHSNKYGAAQEHIDHLVGERSFKGSGSHKSDRDYKRFSKKDRDELYKTYIEEKNE